MIRLDPDVLTLDVEMPVRQDRFSAPVDGVPADAGGDDLRIDRRRGADTTWTALSLSAVDFVTKPRFDLG
ncbi:MAG: hypothetical protein R3E68_06590 [Burkholderiaceae bacterium]